MTAFMCSTEVALDSPVSDSDNAECFCMHLYHYLKNATSMLKALTTQMSILPNYSSLCIDKPILSVCNLKIASPSTPCTEVQTVIKCTLNRLTRDGQRLSQIIQHLLIPKIRQKRGKAHRKHNHLLRLESVIRIL